MLPTSLAKCNAKIKASKKENGVWCVKKVILDHSHDLNLTKARKFNLNKTISLHMKRTIQVNDNVGVMIDKTFHSLVQAAVGYENSTFGERDVRNYIQKERRAIEKKRDAKALVSHFCKMKGQNYNFVYDIDLDDEFYLRNVL